MTIMSPFAIHEVTSREEFDAVIDVEWAAMHEPFRPEFPWMHPVHGYTEEDRKNSIKSDADRRWQSHKSNSASHWFAVTHQSSGQVVGATEWQVYTKNPFPNGPVKLECTWFPGGETREFVTKVINQCYYPRQNWMDRPHISLNGMATLPSFRGRGIATMMMQWGLQQAEELNLECFLEASDPGRDIYEKYDFRPLMDFFVNTHKKGASQTWIKLQHEFPAINCTLMWRPAPKDLREDKEVNFWDVMARSKQIEK